MKFRDAPMPRNQMVLIPTSLDDAIPEDHPIRLFDLILDQLDWSAFSDGFRIEKRGQPPIPPRIVTAVLIFGIYRGVRSSRKLEYQLKYNIEFMWLAHGHQIDHDTFCDFRRRHKKAIKQLHRDFVRKAQQLGVVKLGELYVDGTRIRADANRYRTLTAEKATALLEQADREIEEKLAELELADQNDELFEGKNSGEQLPNHLDDLKKRKEALQDILETCNAMDAERKKQGINPKENPFQLPLADQDSRILPNKEGGYAPNYTPIIGTEGDLGLIVTTTLINSPNEQDQLIAMVDDVEQSYGVTVQTVGADAAYSISTNIVELEGERGKDFLSPHRKGDVLADNPANREDPTEPVAEEDLNKLPQNPSTKRFDSEAFVYDPAQDVHYCPDGRILKRSGKETKTQSSGKTVIYKIYQCPSCEGCPLVSLCRTGTDHKSGRRLRREQHEEIRQQHREKMSQPDTKKRYSKRFYIGERPFGIIKRNFGIRRFMTRGKENVETEWTLYTTAFNIFRVASFLGSVGELRNRLTATNE